MKNVLITGASKGLGAAMAFLFAKNNYNVVINYNKSKKEALQVASQIEEKYHVKTLVVKADISNQLEVDEMITKVLQEFSKIDVLINNASIAKDEDLLTKDLKEFKEVIDVNLIGTFIVSQRVAKEMLKAKQGCIINIASNNGIDCMHPYSLDYDASKAAVISLTHNFAEALAPYIRVNALAPGWIKTESVNNMNPEIIKEEQEKIFLKRFAEPDEIAEVALFLASSKASFINDTVICVDGGQRW